MPRPKLMLSGRLHKQLHSTVLRHKTQHPFFIKWLTGSHHPPTARFRTCHAGHGVHIVWPSAGTNSVVWRAKQPVDHCPFSPLTIVSCKAMTVKTPSRWSVADCIRPELCWQPLAITAALMISAEFNDSAKSCAHQALQTLCTSRTQTPGGPNFGVLTHAVPENSAIGQSASNSGQNVLSKTWRIWCESSSPLLRRAWNSSSSPTIRLYSG